MFRLTNSDLKGVSSYFKSSGIFRRIFISVLSGLIGFSAFFITVILIKFFYHFIGEFEVFEIDTGDFLLSSIGFVFLFLLSFLESLKYKENKYSISKMLYNLFK